MTWRRKYTVSMWRLVVEESCILPTKPCPGQQPSRSMLHPPLCNNPLLQLSGTTCSTSLHRLCILSLTSFLSPPHSLPLLLKSLEETSSSSPISPFSYHSPVILSSIFSFSAFRLFVFAHNTSLFAGEPASNDGKGMGSIVPWYQQPSRTTLRLRVAVGESYLSFGGLISSFLSVLSVLLLQELL